MRDGASALAGVAAVALEVLVGGGGVVVGSWSWSVIDQPRACGVMGALLII